MTSESKSYLIYSSMANTLGYSPVVSFTTPNKPGVLIAGNPVLGRVTFSDEGLKNFGASRFQTVAVNATTDQPSTIKSGSILCRDCEGNGALQCKQCEGNGVNSVDHFDGRFKAGGLCWLCRGKREVLCGNCNGAGFMGGFMSSGDG
ncbi:hypothetical protein V2J09_010332 [Rumex salicifolius]